MLQCTLLQLHNRKWKIFLAILMVFPRQLCSGAREDLLHQRFTKTLIIIAASIVVHFIYLVRRITC